MAIDYIARSGATQIDPFEVGEYLKQNYSYFYKVFEKHNFQYKIIKKCFKLKSAYFAFGNVKVRAKITLTLTGLYFAC